MTEPALPNLNTFKTRHGKRLWFYRRNGRRVRLPGPPGSHRFMEAYEAAHADMPAPEIGASPTIPRSFNHLVVKYYQSPKFTRLASVTKKHLSRHP